MKENGIRNTNKAFLRVSIVVIVLLFIALLTEGILSLLIYRNDSIDKYADQAKNIAISVASAFRSPDQLREAVDTKTETQYWKVMKSYLDDVKKETGVSYLYVLDNRYDDYVYYIMEGALPGEDVPGLCDTDPIEDFAEDMFFDTIHNGGTTTGVFNSEEYGGMFVYSYAAINDSGGYPIAIVGVDIHIGYVNAASARFALKTVMIVLLFGILVGVFALWYIRKSVGKPLDQAAQMQATHERVKVFIDAMPFPCHLWNRDRKVFDCNDEAIRFFKLKDKDEFIERFAEMSPEYQPDGQLSREKMIATLDKAFEESNMTYEWLHQMQDGEFVPVESSLIRVKYGNEYVLAGYSRDLRGHKKMMEEIEHSANLLKSVNEAANILLQTDSSEFEINLHKCMGMIGIAVNADRVCMWKNHTIDGKLYCNLVHDWPGGADSMINNDAAVDVSYDDNTPGWEEILSGGNCINTMISQLSQEEQVQLAAHGVKSLFVAPVFMRGEFWGYVGFDNFREEKMLTENEVNALRSGSILIASAMLRNEMMHNINETAAKLEAEHKKSEELAHWYKSILDATPFPISVTDADKNRTFVNKALEDVLGTPHGDILGKPCSDWGSDICNTDNCSVERAKRGQKRTYSKRKGRSYQSDIEILKDIDGKTAGYIEIVQDITDLKVITERLEEALKETEQANQAKSDFLASMSHEMRTPLNAVIGLSDLTLDKENLDAESFSNLEKIHSAGLTLLGTVNDILDISKIEAGKFELNPMEYDTPSLINDTISQNIMRIGEKPIRFILNISDDLPAMLVGDELRVKQLISNILSNAFKYTKVGTVELNISCARDALDVWVAVEVKDTGIGIKAEDLKKLFKAYNQVDATANRMIEGTGLGLQITRRMAEMMGGSVSVESEYGKGSAFTVKFRQGFVSDAVIGSKTAKNLMNFQYSDYKRRSNSRFTRVSLPNACVLVVDDVATNLDVAKGLMKPYKMRVDCVTSGQEAIDSIKNRLIRYNAIFMDHMMPGMDGVEATRRIREIGTDYAKTIPIIALTANAIVGNEEMLLKKGFQAFISKPIEIERLDDVIRRWVRDDEQTQWTGIKGLNIGIGIDRFGDKDVYLNIMQSFAQNTPPLLDKISEVSQSTLEEYSIVIHGIKGSCRSVGADALGDMAETLEKAAKSGDYEYVAGNNGIFLRDAKKMLSDMNELLPQMNVDAPGGRKERPDLETLKNLLEACESYDMDNIYAIVDDLKSFEYDFDGELVDWIVENAGKYNYTGIITKLSAFLLRPQ